MFYAKKLNLHPTTRKALFAGARETRARGIELFPPLGNAFYWAVGKVDDESNFHQYAFDSATPIMNPLPDVVKYPALSAVRTGLDEYFSTFKLVHYQGSINDANWGVHKHVYDLARRYSLALIDDERAVGSVARFWRLRRSIFNRPPSRGYLLDNLSNEFPMELAFEQPIEPFEAYLISTWQWHSYVTVDAGESTPGNSPTRIISHMLIPDNCSCDNEALSYIDWIENHVLHS